jgi:hypothetical protein
MIREPWKRFVFRRDTRIAQSSRRRSSTKLSPGYEALDTRQLLATGATAATIAILSPPTTAVADAASILERDSPRAFAQLQTALTREAAHSHVTQAEASAIAQDLASIDQAINDASLTSNAASNDINVTQDWVDNTFTYGTRGLSTVDWNLQQTLENVPAVFTPSSSGGATAPLDELMDQLKVVARAVTTTPSLQAALNHSKDVLKGVLGASPDTDLGPGATDRDPLPVYYDAQVMNFVK